MLATAMRTIQSKERLISRKTDANSSPKGLSSAIAVRCLWGWRRLSITLGNREIDRKSPRAIFADQFDSASTHELTVVSADGAVLGIVTANHARRRYLEVVKAAQGRLVSD